MINVEINNYTVEDNLGYFIDASQRMLTDFDQTKIYINQSQKLANFTLSKFTAGFLHFGF